MKIVLLTHQKEISRVNNTGRCVTTILKDDALVVVWDRVNPDLQLLNMINTCKVGLLYPDNQQLSDAKVPEATVQQPLCQMHPNVEQIKEHRQEQHQERNQDQNREQQQKTNQDKFDALILIDATWQEARKIYNRSDYLKALQKISISSQHESIYQLRRNQVEGGLCTAECAAHILLASGEPQKAEQIMALLVQQIADDQSHRN
ncbi:tRNA-uridine aminocarboxypropyltransferase [Shewanella japonica]|uniref:tRNA-uridine aminocarboxypropyltransferase n=1 Tax=Shewanella japonica TaxID=93973 RepID=A0ABN4YCI8_9GAMM|nr:tRNA-uridine aminocarboxypropyltransferase [Shewanella japonica]ARD21763.1 hypothetical protein SJ2017_1439 [Shewanella japonica]